MPKRAAGGQEAPKSAKKSRKSGTPQSRGCQEPQFPSLKKMAEKFGVSSRLTFSAAC